MAFLSRDDILGRDDLRRVRLTVPEWGGDIFVRTMTGYEKDWYETQNYDDQGNALPVQQRWLNLRARMAVLTVCDEQGNSLFTLADMDQLTRKSAPALDRIWEVATRLNGMAPAAEEALKNASATPNDVSGSGSPSL